MNLADVFTYLLVILGFLIAFVSYWLMAFGLFPKMVERAAAQIGRAPVVTALLGAVSFVPLVTICLRLPGKMRPAAIFAIIPLLVLAALFGSAGLALRVGQGLPSLRDAQEPWRRLLRGGIILALTFVLPVVGTFLVMPFALLSGFGAILMTGFRRQVQTLDGRPLSVAPASVAVVSEPPNLPVTAP
jgi:uncharacterized membrane protein